jgi:hypothetical protein
MIADEVRHTDLCMRTAGGGSVSGAYRFARIVLAVSSCAYRFATTSAHDADWPRAVVVY